MKTDFGSGCLEMFIILNGGAKSRCMAGRIV